VMTCFKALSEEMAAATRDNEAMKPYEPHGTRVRARGAVLEPKPGDLVYFDCHEKDGAVKTTEISYSSIWRKRIDGSIVEFFKAVHPDLLPLGYELRSEPRLTIAEGMFGVAESREDKVKDALVALRSRIRFSNGMWRGASGRAPWMDEASPKILSGPKPPSPSMYFRNRTGDAPIFKRDLKMKAHLPQGRKIYLHHAQALQQESWKAHPQPPTEHLDQYIRIQPLERKQTFEFHVDFENLSRQELGLLLFALRPEPTFAHKLGMGKPHGLGSVRITPVSLCVWSPEVRYLEPGGADACWELPEDLQTPSRFADQFAPIAEIETAITASGSKAYDNVHYPYVQDLRRRLAVREKIYEWFVANDLGSKERDVDERPPAGKVLPPIGGDHVPPLPLLRFWPPRGDE